MPGYPLITGQFTADNDNSVDDETTNINNFDVSNKIIFLNKENTKLTCLYELYQMYYVLQLLYLTQIRD